MPTLQCCYEGYIKMMDESCLVQQVLISSPYDDDDARKISLPFKYSA